MTDEIEPAMSAEEWARERIKPSAFDFWHEDGDGLLGERDGRITDEDRHRIAAVALYGQPFGFTAEDVIALYDAAQCEETDAMSTGYVSPCRRIAEKIEALLPPE